MVGPALLPYDSPIIRAQDKILQSFSQPGAIQVTNDGATILRNIGVDNPAAKVLVGLCPC